MKRLQMKKSTKMYSKIQIQTISYLKQTLNYTVYIKWRRKIYVFELHNFTNFRDKQIIITSNQRY